MQWYHSCGVQVWALIQTAWWLTAGAFEYATDIRRRTDKVAKISQCMAHYLASASDNQNEPKMVSIERLPGNVKRNYYETTSQARALTMRRTTLVRDPTNGVRNGCSVYSQNSKTSLQPGGIFISSWIAPVRKNIRKRRIQETLTESNTPMEQCTGVSSVSTSNYQSEYLLSAMFDIT